MEGRREGIESNKGHKDMAQEVKTEPCSYRGTKCDSQLTATVSPALANLMPPGSVGICTQMHILLQRYTYNNDKKNNNNNNRNGTTFKELLHLFPCTLFTYYIIGI